MGRGRRLGFSGLEFFSLGRKSDREKSVGNIVAGLKSKSKCRIDEIIDPMVEITISQLSPKVNS
jgi:hypothetical protein